ncbi:bifunctional UDP-sugar hydrolase/5'-nucleotidase [Paenibacillus sp. Marseille-Q4541]|uniref:bifunctional metallophosphatase/5'-nucleotidase n=1 Tax=Paenibacillus sp. Marseille-Q4541 TaxID=2831522 RepID=UPI001BAC143E|nr:bifunctional UDP-sugar hydrolase/5'-nucleotidase [Paenibacillus sp. Marseille-Q4541]
MNHLKKQILTILHTNDIHSHFNKMGSIAAMISETKKQSSSGEEWLVLDIGDHMDRAAVETEGSMGGANVDILNMSGYDAVTIGNNEGLTFTIDVLNQAYAGLLCPIVCGNLLLKSTGKPPSWMEPYHIMNKGGIRIGLLGATAPFNAFYELLGLEALDPVETLRRQTAEIRDQVDIVIVMSHLGIMMDERIAEIIEGIDVILGGHTHHLLEEPLKINGTVVCGAGKYGQYVGKVTFERNPGQERFSLLSGGCFPVNEELLDERVTAAILTHRKEAEIKLSRTVAITDRELPIAWDEESPFGNLLAQAVRQFTGAELSVVNAGQLMGPLPEGNITEGMLHSLCPSPINACTIQLKGSNLRKALEQSLLPEYRDLVFKGFGFRGYQMGVLCLDGAEVHYDNSKPPYKKITELRVQGIALDDDQVYRVGTLDMFTFNIGYESLSLGSDLSFRLPEFIRDLVGMELQRPQALDESSLPRWHSVHGS